MATLGLFLLLPITTDAYLDPLGVGASLLAGLCWAMYIVFGKRLSATGGANMVAWGMLVAALVAVPYGTAQAGLAILTPHILLAGLAVAVLSSAVPYSLEMFALARLPRMCSG
jgi:inner membrane transporter RhtA